MPWDGATERAVQTCFSVPADPLRFNGLGVRVETTAFDPLNNSGGANSEREGFRYSQSYTTAFEHSGAQARARCPVRRYFLRLIYFWKKAKRHYC